MFEDMAQQGYLLKKRYPFVWKFTAIEPADYSFSVDYAWLSGKSEFKDYKELFAEAGWAYVCSYDGQYIFYASRGARSLYTDRDTLRAKYKRKVITNVVQTLACAIAHIGVLVWLNTYDSWADMFTSWIFWVFFLPLCILPYLRAMRSNLVMARQVKRERSAS